MTTATSIPHVGNDEQLEAIAKIWNDRYLRGGHIWGDEPSLSAETLLGELHPRSEVLEVGCGYGRDLVELLAHGHRVVGLEIARSAIDEANRIIPDREIIAGNAQVLRAAFTKASLPNETFDGLLAHRVLHLLGENGLVRSFEAHANRVLKPGAHLVISARNQNDFKPDQMIKLANGMVEHHGPDRGPGHVIRFWDESLFRQTFSRNFDIIDFIDGKEIESNTNPVDTHFTIMVAQKKLSYQPK